jgi:RNA polymerase-associated protein CTR9
LFRLGVISSNRNENDQSLDYYSRVLAFNPENSTAWYMVGNHHMITKNYRAARKSFEKVLESNRYDIYALCSVGNLCLIFARGDPDPKNVVMI